MFFYILTFDRSQYELIEVWDSEDDELEQAIQASLIDLQYDRYVCVHPFSLVKLQNIHVK